MSEFTVSRPPSLYDYNVSELSGYSDDRSSADEGQGELSKYARYYSDDSFWRKVDRYGRMAGAQALYYALLLWYVATKPSTPLPVKALIFGGLGYFILPIDAVPDFLAGLGYADDVAILFGILTAYGKYMDDESKAKARAKVREILGADVVV